MTKEIVILIADDDATHPRLIEKNLHDTITRFENGLDILNFLFSRRPESKCNLKFQTKSR